MTEPCTTRNEAQPSTQQSPLCTAPQQMTSLQIFRRYITRSPVDNSLDAAGVISNECFEEWASTHRFSAPTLEKFKRAVLGHLSGVDGRVPFAIDEEHAILQVIRRKEAWPVKNNVGNLGVSGFRGKGFHEKSAMGKEFCAKKQAKKGRKMLEENSSSENQVLALPIIRNDDDNNNKRVHVDDEEDTPSFESLGEQLSTAEEAENTSTEPVVQMFQTMDSFLRDVPNLGHEVCGSMFSLGRMLCLARGWLNGPSVHEAEALSAKLLESLPSTHALTMIDFTAKFEDRILYQNSCSVELFGNLCSHRGGNARWCVDELDLLQSFKASMAACTSPGTEVYAKIRVFVAGQSESKAMDCFFMWNRELRILIQRIAA